MIPKEHKKIITVDRLRFVDALGRAQLMSSETRGVKVITSDNPDLGEVREELEAELNSDPSAIGWLAAHTRSWASAAEDDQVE